MNASLGQSPRNLSGMNLRGSFQYRATRPRESHPIPWDTSTRHTIVMKAGHVKSDVCPGWNRECCLSAISIAHSQCCIFRGYLRDVLHLMIIGYGWPLDFTDLINVL